MRLSTFIIQHMDTILQAWEDFARTVELHREALSDKGLRSHAAFILQAVARDMDTPQSLQQEIDKSQGLGPSVVGESAAETHAALRFLDGFTLDQMVSEYRALRPACSDFGFHREHHPIKRIEYPKSSVSTKLSIRRSSSPSLPMARLSIPRAKWCWGYWVTIFDHR